MSNKAIRFARSLGKGEQYVRGNPSYARILWSSNDGRGGVSFSPDELWGFDDGSFAIVGYRSAKAVNADEMTAEQRAAVARWMK